MWVGVRVRGTEGGVPAVDGLAVEYKRHTRGCDHKPRVGVRVGVRIGWVYYG